MQTCLKLRPHETFYLTPTFALFSTRPCLHWQRRRRRRPWTTKLTTTWACQVVTISTMSPKCSSTLLQVNHPHDSPRVALFTLRPQDMPSGGLVLAQDFTLQDAMAAFEVGSILLGHARRLRIAQRLANLGLTAVSPSWTNHDPSLIPSSHCSQRKCAG